MTLATPQPSLPMFYRSLRAIEPTVHLGWGVRSQTDLSAARSANAVPLGVGEFWHASGQYPIVFGPAGAASMPIVVTALLEGRNLFIDANNQWLDQAYVPAWLRRYPFWMQSSPDKQRARLWFDPSAKQVVPLQEDENAQPLFDYQGKPNLALERIIAFCKQCDAESEQTNAFMQALEKHHLLVDRSVTMELTPGTPYTLKGFRMVDEAAYHRLPDTILAQWVRNGWTSLIAMHLISATQNWRKLLQLHTMQNH
ncbi:SapC family protein [Lampropedia aestuarii]|uniref:SapC family protein n=1 Tax=Lampropedia aestuarii TaxID=2562762 RepID=UPI00246959CC|nr:SapC family protein [Lampropedia aestuarii]MDH5855738.1 SapC family protein [Lampropedia aestuarii]